MNNTATGKVNTPSNNSVYADLKPKGGKKRSSSTVNFSQIFGLNSTRLQEEKPRSRSRGKKNESSYNIVDPADRSVSASGERTTGRRVNAKRGQQSEASYGKPHKVAPEHRYEYLVQP